MELSKKDIEKLKSVTSVLQTALSELDEVISKLDMPEQPRKRRNLKQARIEKYKYELLSGRARRKKKE
jgi:hypothetical protein